MALFKIYIYLWYCAIRGRQIFKAPIGKVSLPLASRPLLKASVAQQGEDLILDRILSRILCWDLDRPGFFVDVGAYHPIDQSLTYLLHRRGWRGLAIDPLEVSAKSFRLWRPSDVFIQAVVGEEDDVEVDFFIPKDFQEKSFTSTKYPADEGSFFKSKKRQINLNSELIRQNVEKVDVLSLDVEGAELEILKSLDFSKFGPKVIAVEIHGENMEAALRSPVAQEILKKGYVAVACAVITWFFVDQKELQGPII